MSNTNITVKTNLVISADQSQHWEDVLEGYELEMNDIKSVVTNDFTDENNIPYLIASYCNYKGQTLFESPRYYTVKDCVRDNAIFANAGILTLFHTDIFQGNRKPHVWAN
jgi:hypothetical protein